MTGPLSNAPFAMPMYRAWVPPKIRPWIYVMFLILFQLTGCIYLGAASQISGSTSLMRTDVMFLGMCNVIGVNMPFPLLFRFKFRFTNKSLLLTSALVIVACNLLCLYTRSIPLLALLSFLSGFFKLCGTFECASNVQLWMTSKRDFSIFFPLLYMIVIGDIFLQSWIATTLTYYYSWQMMNWLVIGLMLFVALLVFLLTKPFRFMKPLPLISVDWIGCALWSALMIEVVFLFNYGEYYNWWQGAPFRTVFFMFLITLPVCLQRMIHIRHPYIAAEVFSYRTLLPLLGLYAVAEWINSTPNILQQTFTGAVLHWGVMTTRVFQLFSIAGTLLGCLFTLFWMKGLKMKYTSLLTVGFMALLSYPVMMYFYISPELNIERLYLPTLMRAFGYAIFFTALTIYLQELMSFEHFFMGLTVTGFIRNAPVENIMSGLYGYGLRYRMADNMVRTTFDEPLQSLMVSVKQLFGVTCLLGCLFLLILMLYNVQPVRSTLKKMPYWNVMGKAVRKRLHLRHIKLPSLYRRFVWNKA